MRIYCHCCQVASATNPPKQSSPTFPNPTILVPCFNLDACGLGEIRQGSLCPLPGLIFNLARETLSYLAEAWVLQCFENTACLWHILLSKCSQELHVCQDSLSLDISYITCWVHGDTLGLLESGDQFTGLDSFHSHDNFPLRMLHYFLPCGLDLPQYRQHTCLYSFTIQW